MLHCPFGCFLFLAACGFLFRFLLSVFVAHQKPFIMMRFAFVASTLVVVVVLVVAVIVVAVAVVRCPRKAHEIKLNPQFIILCFFILFQFVACLVHPHS